MNIYHITYTPATQTACLHFWGCNFACQGCIRKKALANFVNFYKAGVRLRAESILIPGYIDSQEIENMAKFIASINPNIPYRIDAYIPVPKSRWRKPASGEVDIAVSVAKKYLHNVSCLKGDEKIRHKVVKIV